MIKRFLTIFSFIIVITAFSAIYANAKDNHLKLSIIDVDYSLYNTNSGDPEINKPNFYNKRVMRHSPILVEYKNKKSILFFLPPVEGSSEKRGIILNYNLGNNKMNVVGYIYGINEQIISVFGYEYTDNDATVLVLTKNNNIAGETAYSTFSNSIVEEDNGLYIKQFKEDKIDISALTNCIDGGTDYLGNKQVCKYKDAASVKKLFDSWKKH